MTPRRSFNTPIPAIFATARLLIEAVDRHLASDFDGASQCLLDANSSEVWNYTDRAWGKGAAARHGFRMVGPLPPHLPVANRPVPRMPDAVTQRTAISRDGFHCRFCGIPVISPAIRRLFTISYPAAVTWGTTNASQHAAFQCVWLQFDHLLPNSRGGRSTLDNIVVACSGCNFGRMEATLDEARLANPLEFEPPVVWDGHAKWDGLERFRSVSTCNIGPRPAI